LRSTSIQPRSPRVAKAPLATVCAVVLASLAGALGGCGSSKSTGTDADPAAAVPAAAAVYAGATVLPSGSQKTAAQDVGRSLTHQSDPYLRLTALLQTPGSPRLDFKHDISPWLGEHAGVFLTSLSSSSSLLTPLAQDLLHGSTGSPYPFASAGAQGAIVLDTSDASKAQSFLNSQATHAGAHATSYRGVSYQATAGGLAFGLVERFAVIGSEAGLHGVIDTTLGAASLVHEGGYSKLLAAAPPQALAHVYFNPADAGSSQPTPATATATAAASQTGLSGVLRLLAGTRQSNISLVPATSSLSIDADSLTSGTGHAAEGLLSSDPDAARALNELPGESWLALGAAHVGAGLAADVQGLQSVTSLGSALGGSSGEGASVSGGFGLKPLLESLTTPLKLLGANSAQAKRDFASWMGSAGIFAAGGSLLELKAAVSIESKNPDLSRAAVGKLAAQLRKVGWSTAPVSIPGTDAAVGARVSGLPVVLDIANGTDSSGHTKFVLGLAEASVEAALKPPNTMSEATTRQAAATALGEGIQPSLILDFPTLLSLFEGIGLTESPELSPVVPYLRSATTLAGGGHALGGEVERFRLVLGLQQPTG
jgi:hypothetical protein